MARIAEMRGNHSIRRISVFDPLLKRTDHVEQTKTFGAMVLAGNHEQANGLLGLPGIAQGSHYTLVIVDRVLRRNAGIVPPVIENQLPMVGYEFFQIWVGGI